MPGPPQLFAVPPGHLTPASWAVPFPHGFDPYDIALSAGVPWFDGVSIVVRVAFSTNPGSPPGWDDISAYVRRISTRRGRTSELETYQAGTASIELENSDRRFDPTYTAGPYYPNVLPMRRINIQATYGGITYDIFTGYVDGWPQSYEKPNFSTVEVTATDAFKFLANARVPGDVYALEVVADTPSGWYRLGEQSGTVMADSSGNGRHGTYVGGATLHSTTGLVSFSSNCAIDFDGVDDFGTIAAGSNPMIGIPFTVEFFMKTTTVNTEQIVGQIGANNFYLDIFIVAGTLEARIYNGAASSQQFITTETFNDGAIHHVVCTFDTAASLPVIYVDGRVRVGTGFQLSAVSWGSGQVTVANSLASSGVYWSGILDEVIFYQKTLSVARVLAHYAAATTPWAGDDTGARVTHILDLIGWPVADRSIAVGKAVLGNATLDSETALPMLKKLETSEQGYLFVGPNGWVTFQNRHQRLTSTASLVSQATFGDTAGTPYADVTLPYNDNSVTNRVKGNRVGSSTVLEVTDAASIATYLERAIYFPDLLQGTDLEVVDFINWRLSHYKDPLLRIDAMTVNPRKIPATMFPQVLGLNYGSRVTVVRNPQGVGSAITKDVHIEGINHTITTDSWLTSYYLSPADTQTYFLLDDATLGQLDFNRLGF